jgi:hypothetical protein
MFAPKPNPNVDASLLIAGFLDEVSRRSNHANARRSHDR